MANSWFVILLLPMLWYAYTLLKLRNKKGTELTDDKSVSYPLISVVIPFRNESRWISDLLDSLELQDYPAESWELILVDDHSLDSGPLLVRKAIDRIPVKTQLISLEKGSGKKFALKEGIERAQFDWILATDADCCFKEGWLRSYADLISTTDANMICGPVLFRENRNNWLASFQKFEQAILMFVGKASILNANAFLANGANMAFKKSLFKQADLKESDTPSGDDIFLLHHIKQMDPAKVIFNDAAEALVRTPAMESILRFIDQRIRWASKSRYYKDADSLRYGLAIALGNGILVFALCLFLLGFLQLWAFLGLICLKLTVDAIIFFRSRKYAELRYKWLSFLLIFPLYPLYTIGIALLSLLYKPRWKGRKI